MRVLVCGGRDYAGREELYRVLDELHRGGPIQAIISGAARGADSLAAEWGLEAGVGVALFPADWKAHGRAAGPLRNQQMLDEGSPDLVVAFPGGAVTHDLTRRALEAEIPVIFRCQ